MSGQWDGGAVPPEMTAIAQLVAALGSPRDAQEVVASALDALRSGFGWSYGVHWRVGPDGAALRYAQDRGTVAPEFREATRLATIAAGAGPCGAAWESADVVAVPGRGAAWDHARASQAQRAGIVGVAALPLVVRGDVVGVLEFLATGAPDAVDAGTDGRRGAALRTAAAMIGQTLERIAETDRALADVERLTVLIGEVAGTAGAVRERIAAAAVRAAATRDALADLGHVTSTVDSLVRVVTSIAGQADLLLLNATPDDTGHRLAAMADEVKRFAQQTGEAIGEVEQRIGAIRSDTAVASAGVAALAEAMTYTAERIAQVERLGAAAGR